MQTPIAEVAAELVDVPVDCLTVAERQALPHQGNRRFDLWLGSTPLIAKLFCHSDPKRRLISAEREHSALQLLHPSVLAPGPRGFRGGPEPVVIYDYVPGSMWDRQPPSPVQLYQLAEYWLRLAEVPTAGLWLAQGQDQSWSAIESLLHRSEIATSCTHWCVSNRSAARESRLRRWRSTFTWSVSAPVRQHAADHARLSHSNIGAGPLGPGPGRA